MERIFAMEILEAKEPDSSKSPCSNQRSPSDSHPCPTVDFSQTVDGDLDSVRISSLPTVRPVSDREVGNEPTTQNTSGPGLPYCPEMAYSPVPSMEEKSRRPLAKIFKKGKPTQDLDVPLALWRRSLIVFALVTAGFMVRNAFD